jgi:hypothetical protein
MRMRTFVADASKSREWLMAVGDIVESLLLTMAKVGVATAEEVDIDTFRDRLLQEAISNGSVIVGRSEIGMWTNAQRDAA